MTGPLSRTVTTAQDGAYSLPRLVPGDYRITVTKFGYGQATATVAVVAEQSTTTDVTLTPAASAVVSGTVTTAGAPEAGATVAARGTPVSAVTDASGRYRLTLPHGAYELTVTPASRCSSSATAEVTVAGDVTKDIELPLRGDNFGYTCRSGSDAYVAGTDRLALTGDDEATQVTLPFTVPYYGTGQSRAWVTTNGFATFAADRATTGSNATLPSTGAPNLAVYPFWDDLSVDAQAGVYTATSGTAPRRTFVIEWRNVTFYSDTTQRMSFSVLLGEDGSIGYRYKDVDSERERGSSATVGIENAGGTDGLLYSYNTAALTDGQSLAVTASRHGLAIGTVTDANDGDPLAGAQVKIGDVATFTTGADGAFYGQVPSGDYTVEVSREHYGTFSQQVTIAPGTLTRIDTALVTGRVSASVAEVTVVMPAEASRARTVELTNLGSPTAYTATADAAWLTVAPAAGELAKASRRR
ncbi:carboxypeptidase regulatory-like domain-containing protein [Nonomuraea recticatena]|uniref:carboxypeptidase regulatory-like domain-containing protein n=1 Tax=Nonomuraea recticatena TaxID=46178 RepID=UPI003618B175